MDLIHPDGSGDRLGRWALVAGQHHHPAHAERMQSVDHRPGAGARHVGQSQQAGDLAIMGHNNHGVAKPVQMANAGLGLGVERNAEMVEQAVAADSDLGAVMAGDQTHAGNFLQGFGGG